MDGLMDLKAETVKSSETETPPLRRWLSLDTSVGYKGLTVMTIMTGLSILSWLLAKNHVMMQNYFAIESSEITSSEALTQAQIEKLIAPQFLNSTTESEDLSKIDDILDISDHVPLMAAGDDMDQVTVVHYIWCGNRFLDFRHYIAIKSTIQAVRPDRVLFHYHRLPMHDTDGYFTWFELLLQTFDNILLLNVNKTSQRECRANGAERFLLVLDVLEKYGGMYMPEEAIFLRVPPRHLTKSFVSGVGSCTLRFFSEGIVMAKKDNFSLPQTEEALLKMISNCHGDQEGLRPCTQEKRFMENTDSRPSCIRLETTLFPKDVWGSYDRLSNLTKLVAYGKTDVRPKRSILAADRTPRIAHYLCTDDCVLTFGMYVSILSALHVGDLYRVVVHGPKTPTGIWWKRLQQQEAGNVLYLHREFPLSAVEPGHPVTYEVGRYVMRTQILMQYGGVFHDSHVIWTQRLPDEMMEYEVVASPDWHNLGNWPESMNHGLLIARHSARYLQQLLKIYYANDGMVLPWVTDHYLSYRLIELDPTLVYLHSHLQVKCLNNNCHPTWQPDFRSHFMQNRPGLSFDWRRETMSIHWLDSRSALDVDKIKFASGIIVEVTRYILTSAGVSLESL